MGGHAIGEPLFALLSRLLPGLILLTLLLSLLLSGLRFLPIQRFGMAEKLLHIRWRLIGTCAAGRLKVADGAFQLVDAMVALSQLVAQAGNQLLGALRTAQ